MLKVTIYPTDSLDVVAEYIEGVTEVGGTRKVKKIQGYARGIDIEFENGEHREFNGFRYIIDGINEQETTKAE
jgi:hypothetical protein